MIEFIEPEELEDADEPEELEETEEPGTATNVDIETLIERLESVWYHCRHEAKVGWRGDAGMWRYCAETASIAIETIKKLAKEVREP